MGLCKCPKRKVTNLFCYEHRVNVCEHCMVAYHPECIVQSYLHWLEDSDYSDLCQLCHKGLHVEDCVRLICYHLFHWACIDSLARQLPATTAPAGFRCPTCNAKLFPAPNLVSPVADVLREKLAGVNWARVGLGLPLLSEDKEVIPSSMSLTPRAVSINQPDTALTSVGDHCVAVTEEPIVAFSRQDSNSQLPRRPFQTDNPKQGAEVSRKHYDDENKYHRKPAVERMYHWWRPVWCPSAWKLTKRRNFFVIFVMCVLIFGMVMLIFSKLGNMATENDPNLDPDNNPQIRRMH